MGLRSTVALVSAVGLCAVAACGGQHEPGGTKTPASTSTTAPAVTTSVTSPQAAVGTEPTQPVPPTATAALGYTSKLVPIKGQDGTTTWDVQLPQLEGGNPAVRDRFNSGMKSALDNLIKQFSDDANVTHIWAGSLSPEHESSRVTRITERLVAGMALFGWDAHAAHPNQTIATTVINTATAQPITFADVFPDVDGARARLRVLVAQLDPTSRLAHHPLEDKKFLNWLPTPEGMRIYVIVAHAVGDYVPVTVPWDKIQDLVPPDVLSILRQ